MSNTRDAIYLEGNYNLNNVSLNNIYAYCDTPSYNSGCEIYSGSGNISTLDVINSTFIGGYYGLYTYADKSLSNVLIDSSTGISNNTSSNYALYLSGYYLKAENIQVTNSHFESQNYQYGRAGYIYSSDGFLKNITIDNNVFDAKGYGFYAEGYAGNENFTFTNNTVNAQYRDGVAIFASYGGLRNVKIENNDVSSFYEGIEASGEYSPGTFDVTIKNNTINSSNSTGIYSYTDGEIDGFDIIDNNITKSSYGIDVEGYSGTSNIKILNNDIQSYYTGIYLYYLDSNIQIKGNDIRDTGNGAYLNDGIYFSGEYNFASGIHIEDNYIQNAGDPIYGEYTISNVYIKNNIIDNLNSPNSGVDAIYLEDFIGGDLVISGNQILSTNQGDDAIYLYNCNIDTMHQGIISNNFITNYNNPLYIYLTPNLKFVNNSIATNKNNTLVYIDEYSDNFEMYNNIFKVDTAIFSGNFIEYYNSTNPIKGMNHNVYNLDTMNATLVYNDWNGTPYQDISDWNAFSGLSANDMNMSVNFNNDTTNLHLTCGESSLNSGMSLPYLMVDIDGNDRADIPTIGADELLASNNLFGEASEKICANPIVLNAGGSGSQTSPSYSWSTGETTQSILVADTGMYWVALTDACGTYNDTISVEFESPTTASFNTNISFATGQFMNTSINGDSYAWDFGDGNTSTQENPVHLYSTTGLFDVTLITYGDCNNDTITQQILLQVASIDENNNASFIAYPNPVNDVLMLKMSNSEKANLTLIDIQGRIIEENIFFGSTQLNFEQLNKGVYIVRINQDGKTYTQRIVKQ